MFIADRRGEILFDTYDYLKAQGYNVLVLNLNVLDLKKGNQFNLLNEAIKAAKEGKTAELIEIAWNIAYAIVGQNRKYNEEKIWIDGEAGTIAGLILLTILDSEFEYQKHMRTAYTLLSELGQIKEDETIPLIDYVNSLAPDHPAKEAFKTLLQSPYKTRASIITSTLVDLKLFSNDYIADMTAKQDHDLEKIGIDKTAVFILFEDWIGSNSFLVNLYLEMVYSNMIDLAARNGGRIPRTVNIIIDEMACLNPISDLALKLSIAPTRGIKFTLSVQDISQIKNIYKEAADKIIENIFDLIFLNTADIETAKFISEKAGNILVVTKESNAIRPFISPNEILIWNREQSLILSKDKKPLKCLLPDISLWTANKEFGFIKDKNLDKEMDHNREVFERVEKNIPTREIQDSNTWLPKLN